MDAFAGDLADRGGRENMNATERGCRKAGFVESVRSDDVLIGIFPSAQTSVGGKEEVS